jgi:tetratricopeptide (TPR) repeat protein
MLFFNLPLDIARTFDQISKKKGIKALERLLRSKELDKGPEHPETLEAVNTLGGLLASTGDMKGAELMFRRALTGREKALGEDSPDTEIALCNLGCILMQSGDYRGSLEYNLRLLKCRERRLTSNHSGVACALIDLGFAYKALRELDQAEAMYSRAVKIAEKVMLPGCNDITIALHGLAETLMVLHRIEGVLPLLNRAAENHRLNPDPFPPVTVLLYSTLGWALEISGDLEGARTAWRTSLRAAEQDGTPDSPDAIYIGLSLGQSLAEAGEPAEAIRHLGKAASWFRATLGPEHRRTVMTEHRLEIATLAHWIHDKGALELMKPEFSPDAVVKGLKRIGAPKQVRNGFLGILWLNPLTGGPGLPYPDADSPLAGILAGRTPGGPGAAPAQDPPLTAVRKALAILAFRKGELKPHEDTVKAEVSLGNAILTTGRIADAADAYARACAAAVKSFGNDSPAALGAEFCFREAQFRILSSKQS